MGKHVVNEFREYRKLWNATWRITHASAAWSVRHLAERLLEEENGERSLTDLMHIGELVYATSPKLTRQHLWLVTLASRSDIWCCKMVRWRWRRHSTPWIKESLVQIVTIHKSKGLEYDWKVFLPFIGELSCEASEGKSSTTMNQIPQCLILRSGDGALLASR